MNELNEIIEEKIATAYQDGYDEGFDTGLEKGLSAICCGLDEDAIEDCIEIFKEILDDAGANLSEKVFAVNVARNFADILDAYLEYDEEDEEFECDGDCAHCSI